MAAKKRKPAKYEPLVDLSADELQLLMECPYEEPGRVTHEEKRVAERLIERGLLERDPNTPKNVFLVRCTSDGETAARPLSHARVKYERDRIEALFRNTKEDINFVLAHRLERILWKRVLVECALGGSRTANTALETADFIT